MTAWWRGIGAKVVDEKELDMVPEVVEEEEDEVNDIFRKNFVALLPCQCNWHCLTC